MKSLSIQPDDIQLCLSLNIPVVPNVYYLYINHLADMASQDKLCLVPSTVLEWYNTSITRKINKHIGQQSSHVSTERNIK